MSPVPSSAEVGPLDLDARQVLWASTSSSAAPASTATCMSYTIQAPGLLTVNDTFALNFTSDVVYQACGVNASSPFNSTIGETNNITEIDPYFASTSPVAFVLGVCVTVAWILLIMLLMTPRTYLTGVGSSRQRPDESINVVGLGSRPWFQKVATLFVAISLLLATVRTFSDAANQYDNGFQDSAALTQEVLGSTEIQVIRLISAAFEWLAQAQTALRLFPRHRERIAIKWVALTLIVLEIIFTVINNFTSLGNQDDDGELILRPRHYNNAFPALQYLFELALSLMYAAVISYYAMTKSRFAFYHPEMWNISLVALLSMVAVLVPVVFFVLDIAVPNIVAWGIYIRWVGAAAASVIVWEWVERIEALEREERKDGILGREIFEGDDMLGGEGGDGASKKRGRRKRNADTTTGVASPTTSGSTTDSSAMSLKKASPEPKSRYSRVNKDVLRKIAAIRSLAKAKGQQANTSNDLELQPATGAVRRRRQRVQATGGTQPPPLDPATAAQTSASPVSRSDCTSASTVYRVVHHSISPSSTPGISETLGQTMNVVSPVLEEEEPETQGEGRRSLTLSIFRRRSSGNSGTIPPEILAQQAQPHAKAETGSEKKGKGKSGFGFFNRFRRTTSEERDLPDLVVPWRGDNNTTPLQDLESGRDTQHSTSFDEPDSVWHNGGLQQPQQHTIDENFNSHRVSNGQILSRTGNVVFSEDPDYAGRDLPP